MATQYGALNKKLSLERVARLYARAMAYSETWYTNSDPANARASHGTRSIGSVARERVSSERELSERTPRGDVRDARDAAREASFPPTLSRTRVAAPAHRASDTVKLSATSFRREHRHVTNRLRDCENQIVHVPY
jgi:hypothetical protein